ncbi:MAG: HdeD family acid-resistance protein [Candidatus Ancaeobacter aquaticus]|nr:HdeD family acid-resistance protein [Candidatus Ancaeobacter aquaticus]
MENALNNNAGKIILAKYWWVLAVRGIFALLFGIFAFTVPGITLEVLILFFGVFVFLDGVCSLVSAFHHHPDAGGRGELIVRGICGIAAGLITYFYPGITAIVFLYIIAFWAIVAGIFEAVVAFKLPSKQNGKILLLLSGFLSILFGAFLIFWPLNGIVVIVYVIGVYALMASVTLVSLAFIVRKGISTHK